MQLWRSPPIQDSQFRYLAVAQGAGAFSGLLALRIWGALAPGAISVLAMALALAYLSLALFASFLLWRRHPLALPLSLVVQVPQIFAIIGPDASFHFLAGVYARLSISADAIALGFGGGGVAEATLLHGPVPGRLGMDFYLAFAHRFQPPTGAPAYSVNILAAMVSLHLMRAWANQEDSPRERTVDDTSSAA